MKINLISVLIAAALSAGFSASAVAASKPGMVVQSATATKDNASPVDETSRLAVFNYDDNLVYNILTQEGVMTHIELPVGETVQGFYISGDPRWKSLVTQDKTRVFIKPTLPGLFNAATLVTSSRVFELTFSSGRAGEPWYQRVRWAISDFNSDATKSGTVSFDGVSDFSRSSSNRSSRSGASLDFSNTDFDTEFDAPVKSSRSSRGGPRISPEKLNFGYEISGGASFKPISVFDDGKFTWIQMSESPTLPALFMKNEAGEMEIVNYTVHGGYLMVSQLVPGLVLRLANEEVTVSRKSACSGFWCVGK